MKYQYTVVFLFSALSLQAHEESGEPVQSIGNSLQALYLSASSSNEGSRPSEETKRGLMHTRPLAKLASADEMQGELGAQDRSVSTLHEDPSTKQQFAAEVEFRKRSTQEMLPLSMDRLKISEEDDRSASAPNSLTLALVRRTERPSWERPRSLPPSKKKKTRKSKKMRQPFSSSPQMNVLVSPLLEEIYRQGSQYLGNLSVQASLDLTETSKPLNMRIEIGGIMRSTPRVEEIEEKALTEE